MSSLQSSIQQKRAERQNDPTPSCVVIGSASGALVVSTWNAGTWSLPWSYLLSAHHHVEAPKEWIVLRYAHTEVRVEGERLAGLIPAIAAQRLEFIRDLPPPFRHEVSADEAFIEAISVRSLTELTPLPASTADGS